MRLGRRSAECILAACLPAVACSSREAGARAVLYDPAHPFPPRPAEAPVQIFSATGPECAHVTIGTVSTERSAPLPSRETMAAMTREARRIGGEAIVVLGTSGPQIAGTVIRFSDSTCTR